MHRVVCSTLALIVVMTACSRKDDGTTPVVLSTSASSASTSTANPTASISSEPSVAAPNASQVPVQTPVQPDGYVLMTVLDVTATNQGDAVWLVSEEIMLPIFVGGTEAFSIQLRLGGQHFARPLTHDLLDTLVKKLGGDVWKVHVDELRGNTFIGSVFVRQGEHTYSVDARPSDAIALALGNKVPIYVARTLLDSAGMKKKDLEKLQEGELRSPSKRAEPFAL